MQNVLKREFITWCHSAASRLAAHDSAVLLGMFLCFAPFPPVNLLGLSITCLNFLLVWNKRLPKSEIPMLRTAVFAFVAYACLWTVLVFWLIHAAVFPTLAGWLKDWGLDFWGAMHPRVRPLPFPVQRI